MRRKSPENKISIKIKVNFKPIMIEFYNREGKKSEVNTYKDQKSVAKEVDNALQHIHNTT